MHLLHTVTDAELATAKSALRTAKNTHDEYSKSVAEANTARSTDSMRRKITSHFGVKVEKTDKTADTKGGDKKEGKH